MNQAEASARAVSASPCRVGGLLLIVALLLGPQACSSSRAESADTSLSSRCSGTFRVTAFGAPALHVASQNASAQVTSRITFARSGSFNAGVGFAGFLGHIDRKSSNQAVLRNVTYNLGVSNKARNPSQFDAEQAAQEVLTDGTSQMICRTDGVKITRGAAFVQLSRNG